MYYTSLEDYWPGRRVALTGATGFIGHRLAMQLTRLGGRVTALVRPSSNRSRLAAAGIPCTTVSLEDSDGLVRAFAGREFVFHLAGAVDFENDWERFLRVNVAGTRQVVAAAQDAGVRRLIHTSSIVAVGAADEPEVLNEKAIWNLGSLRIPYVTSKRRAEELALAVSARKLEVVVVNPAAVVGPDDFSASEFGTLCRRFWRRRILLNFGGGNSFVDVRDVAEGMLLAAMRGRAGERYILGGTNRSMTAFFADLARAADKPIMRVRLPNAFGTVVAYCNQRWPGRAGRRSYFTRGQAKLAELFFYFSSEKARRELGYQPRPLAGSIRDAHAFWMAGSKSA